MYRCLIVEDEKLMREYLTEELTHIHPHWEAAAQAGDGREAVALLEQGSFDLVLTDIKMPDMDGLELAEYIEKNCPCTYVAILSGYDEFDYARRAFRLNVHDYLLKPLNEAELAQMLEQVEQRLLSMHPHERQTSPCPPTAPKLIQNVCAYLCESFQQGISLSMVADRFHVTPSYLSSLFHKEVGMPYSKFLLQLRMQTAARLLTAAEEMRIYEVAKACGFLSDKHFIYVFRNYFKQSPSEYKRAQRATE
jgi:YesN/AraC family two-component response regulator